MQTMSSGSARAQGSVFSEEVLYALKKLEMESITPNEEQLELISWQPLSPGLNIPLLLTKNWYSKLLLRNNKEGRLERSKVIRGSKAALSEMTSGE